MKNCGKSILICIVIFMCAVSPVFSQTEIKELQRAVNSFSGEMAKSLPFNSTIGLNWSDAYIGQLISMPPHFGIGVSLGVTTIPINSLNSILSAFDADMMSKSNFPLGFTLPAYTVEARIGGFILPFDIGVKFGYLNMNKLNINMGGLDFGTNMGIKFMLIGADIRYALINSKLMPLKLSVGLGINHLSGGISTEIPANSQSFAFTSGAKNYMLSASDPVLDLEWETTCLELKAHVSFPLFIITPYAGLGVSYAWSRSGYQLNSRIMVKEGGNTVPIDDVKGILNDLGVTGISNNGFESMIESQDFNIRFYGGFSINMAVMRLDLTGMYNIFTESLGLSIGLRFQL